MSDYGHLSTEFSVETRCVLRDVTRFLKSDWFSLYYALYQAFSSREKVWLREARYVRIFTTSRQRATLVVAIWSSFSFVLLVITKRQKG